MQKQHRPSTRAHTHTHPATPEGHARTYIRNAVNKFMEGRAHLLNLPILSINIDNWMERFRVALRSPRPQRPPSLAGGDMMTWLIKKDVFAEADVRFYIAELALAVHSIHHMKACGWVAGWCDRTLTTARYPNTTAPPTGFLLPKYEAFGPPPPRPGGWGRAPPTPPCKENFLRRRLNILSKGH